MNEGKRVIRDGASPLGRGRVRVRVGVGVGVRARVIANSFNNQTHTQTLMHTNAH